MFQLLQRVSDKNNKMEEKNSMHLSHIQGEKWSVFTTNNMDSLFRDLPGVIPEIEMVCSSITIPLG